MTDINLLNFSLPEELFQALPSFELGQQLQFEKLLTKENFRDRYTLTDDYLLPTSQA